MNAIRSRCLLAALMTSAATVSSAVAESFWSRNPNDSQLMAFELDPQSGASRLTMQSAGGADLGVAYLGIATEPGTGVLWAIYTDPELGREAIGRLQLGKARPKMVALIESGYTFTAPARPAFSPAGVLYAQAFDTSASRSVLVILDRHTGEVTPVIPFPQGTQLLGLAFSPSNGKLYMSGLEGCGATCDFSFVDTLSVPQHVRGRLIDSSSAFVPSGDLLFSHEGELLILSTLFYRMQGDTFVPLEHPLTFLSPAGPIVPALADAAPAEGTEGCLPGARRACLQHRRFAVEATYDASVYGGSSGPAEPQLESDQSLKFTFFDPRNLELFVKVIDGCGFNGHFWIFASGLTDVAVSLRVTDTVSGAVYGHENPAGTAFLPLLDIQAFACNP